MLYVLRDELTFYELLGPVDINGNECPVSCPGSCAAWEMSCPGREDGYGCMIPDFCMPITGNSFTHKQ